LTRPSIFIRDKRILFPERMLQESYDRKGSLEKEILVVGLKGLGA
jgi:hypothetical protein